MAHLIQVPIFNPATPAQPTAAEWTTYEGEVLTANAGLQFGLTLLDPNYQHPALPAEYTANPTTPTTRLAAAGITTAHLATIHTQLQLQQLRTQMQAQINLAQAQGPQQPPPIAAPIRIKAALPKEFDGKATKASTFIAACKNYFMLNPMTDDQQIRFALQLMQGEAENWMKRQLQLLRQAPPPAHFATWAAFIREFSTRFVDTQEREKASAQLMQGKINQTTSARLFIDQIQEACNKAGWANDDLRMDAIRLGLKEDVSKAIALYRPTGLADLIQTIITADENLQ